MGINSLTLYWQLSTYRLVFTHKWQLLLVVSFTWFKEQTTRSLIVIVYSTFNALNF